MNLNFNLENSLVFGSDIDVFGLRKCNYGKFLEMHHRHKINQTIGRHSKWSYLRVCWVASGDTSPKIWDICENSRGAVKTYKMCQKTAFIYYGSC